MLAINRVLDSPELLEAGEFGLIRHTLLITGNLLPLLDEMPPKLLNEIGADKVARCRKGCAELDSGLLSAYDRRVRWVDVPLKKSSKRGMRGQIVFLEQTRRE